MGNFPPSNRDNELRLEKLYLMPDIARRLDSGVLLSLDDFLDFFWQGCPGRVEHAKVFLMELVRAKREGRAYTNEDFARFKKVCKSCNSRKALLDKLIHLGVIEKRNNTIQQYEIIISDKWIERLKNMMISWVMLTE